MTPKQENGIQNLPHADSSPDSDRKPKPEIQPLRQRLSSWRWATALIVWFGFLNTTLMGNSFNMALVCMTGSEPPPRIGDNITSLSGLKNFTMNSSNNYHPDPPGGEFDWDGTTQGIILSSSMYIGFIAPAFGGFLPRRFGAKKVIGISLTMRSMATLLTPIGARTHLYVLIAIRVVAGMLSNTMSPSTQELWSHWAPDQEKAQLLSTSMSGLTIGSLLASLISGFLCTIPIDNGWPFVFYVFGGASTIWCVVWWILVYDSPEQHPWIKQNEKQYIMDNMKTKPDKSTSIPYKAMFTSRPVWAFFVIQAVHRWCLVVIVTYLPKYMRDVLRFPIELNAVASSVPFASRFIGAIFWGVLAEQMSKRIISTTTNRKIVQSTGFLTAAAITASLGFVSEDNRVLAVVLFVITMFFQSCTFASSSVIPLDMAPRLASVVTGVFLGAAAFISMFAPITVAYLTPDGTLELWRNVFFILVGCYVFGVIVFVLFGSAEVQPWGESQNIVASTLNEDSGNIAKDGVCANGEVGQADDVMLQPSNVQAASELNESTDIFNGGKSGTVLSGNSVNYIERQNNTGNINYACTDEDINSGDGARTEHNVINNEYTHCGDVSISEEKILNTRL